MFSKNRISKLALLLMLAFFSVSQSAWAFGKGGWFQRSPEKRAEHMLEHVADELALTPDQLKVATKIKDELLAKFKGMHDGKQEVMQALQEEFKAPAMNETRLQDLMNKKHQSMGLLMPFMLQKLTEFHAVLTPEQRTKVAGLLQEMSERHGGMH